MEWDFIPIQRRRARTKRLMDGKIFPLITKNPPVEGFHLAERTNLN